MQQYKTPLRRFRHFITTDFSLLFAVHRRPCPATATVAPGKEWPTWLAPPLFTVILVRRPRNPGAARTTASSRRRPCVDRAVRRDHAPPTPHNRARFWATGSAPRR